MKLQYLGTAAAEGVPGIFCNCATCVEARKRGGKNFRSRSQAIIDDELLIDFPADTLMHCQNYGIDLTKIQHCLLTHTHPDHLYCTDLSMRRKGCSNLGNNYPFIFYGLEGAMKVIDDYVSRVMKDATGMVEVRILNLYETADVGGFKVTPLLAIHDTNSFPAFYVIENKEGKRVMYAHDTNYFCEEVWDYLKNNSVKLDFVSLDCTEGNVPRMNYKGHMNLNDNVAVKERLMDLGCADENTLFCSNHFSHNGKDVLYEEFSEIAGKEKFLTSYDGMVVHF